MRAVCPAHSRFSGRAAPPLKPRSSRAGGWQLRAEAAAAACLMAATALSCGAPTGLETAQVTTQVADGVSTQIASAAVLPPRVAQLVDDQLMDSAGDPIALHGFSWFGFNNGDTMVDGLWGSDPVGSDFANAVWRQKLLGFNAVRLPFSFKDMQLTPRNFTQACGSASKLEVVQAVIDPQVTAVDASLAPALLAPPLRQSGMCNDYLPSSSTLDRLVYVVQFYLNNGFYVLLDNHLREDSTALDNSADWAAKWADLVERVMQDPAASGRVFFDILNEPDEFQLAWEKTAKAPGLHDLYMQAMDAIWAVSSDAVFFLEGAGQLALNTNWGDGYCTDAGKIASLSLSDPRPFFRDLRTKPYAQRVVLAPHVYGPAVTTATNAYSGQGLYDRLNSSFGSLTGQGFCIGSNCQKFPIAIGEFGSTFVPANDVAFMTDFATYLNAEGAAADKVHKKIVSWFYWDWNANSGDTGGLVADDWWTTQWTKVRYLQGRLGLTPWWLAARGDSAAGKAQVPAAQVPAAQVPAAQVPAAQVPAAQVPPYTPVPAPAAAATPSPGPAAVSAPAAAPAPPPVPSTPPLAASNPGSSAAAPPLASKSFGCEVRAHVDNSWQVGGGYAAALNLTITNPGKVAMTPPYSVAIVGRGYRAVLGSWNIDKPMLNGSTIHGVASQSWQVLAPQRANTVNLGLTLQGDYNDFMPRQVLLQGVACQLVSGI